MVKDGSLTVIDAAGASHTYGDGHGSRVAIRIADSRLERHLATDPELALGEGYMDGRLVMLEGRIYDLLALLLSNARNHKIPGWTHAASTSRYLLRRFKQFNPRRRAERNVAHHYDIKGDIYDLFLDRDRQYSCAYFTPGADLEEAQLAKKLHLAAKLAIEPGHRVLDIGSGWGGLGLYLAKATGAKVTGITLSREQLKVSNERAAKEGIAHAARFLFEDYRDLAGQYDRIVSVGMFEHVGVNHYVTYFRRVRELLARDGVAVIHSIGRSEQPCATNPFIAKYIFPGGYIPSLSEMVAAIEKSGLIISDVEILRLHYAETLKAWRERFVAHWDEASRLLDETFCRMWEFYLAGSETAFRYQDLVVFQVQLVRRIETLPMTRDYMLHKEQDLRTQAAHPPAHAVRAAGE
ncbi:MAG: class I SAM-dependent methyltransferase [Hyphomicrobiales bacterium]|nr:MAG: class I SAM-dependent methyltransferase [Hyphomicrobiales bacterium]